MAAKSRWFPFTAEQTVNIMSEFGPLVTMFIVNAFYGKTDPELFHGTVALIATTLLAIVAMWTVLHRLPVFPLVASSVTVVFGLLTILTGNPMWVQIKVTIFNAMFAGVLFGGLYGSESTGHHRSLGAVAALSIFGLVATLWPVATSPEIRASIAAAMQTEGVLGIFDKLPQIIPVIALIIGFMIGAKFLKSNFFKYVFEKTFHYTDEGWNRFTWSFAWFFVLTAVLNEAVRYVFPPTPVEAAAACKQLADAAQTLCLDGFQYHLLGWSIDGINIWILFKVVFIMPLSGLYAWYLTRLMQKYRMEEPQLAAAAAPAHRRGAA